MILGAAALAGRFQCVTGDGADQDSTRSRAVTTTGLTVTERDGSLMGACYADVEAPDHGVQPADVQVEPDPAG
jgi:hypothetical protein